MSWLAVRRRTARVDPLRALAAAPAGAGERFYLEHPETGEARVGVGTVARCVAEGAERFASLATAAGRVLRAGEVRGVEAPAWAGPLLLGGFAFESTPPQGDWAGFASADWILPELLLVQRGEDAWLSAVAPAPAGADAGVRARLEARLDRWQAAMARQALPERAPVPADALEHRAAPDAAPRRFATRVERALADIASGHLEKVVVARSVTVSRPGGFDPAWLVQSLRERLPSCASFLVTRGDACFFGASPERLLRRTGRRLETAAVAGTAPRGRSPEEDAARARALVESKKEQAEHAVVLRFLRERLARHASRVEAPESPELLRLESLQHLRSPVTAWLDAERPLLALAGELHPTPATGGAPSGAARRWLRRHEGLERGWYAGPVGFTDARGDGELWVALRSGLARGDALRLFAGAGIVEGSDPGAELSETRLKLGTLLQRALEL